MSVASDRYTGPRVGISRELTPSETDRLREAAQHIADRPPWTPKRMRGNTNFRKTLMQIYEDGVGSRHIADALDWQVSRVGMHIRQARAEGLGAGSRRYIAPPERPSDAAKRALEPREADDLLRQFESVPRTSNKAVPRWGSKEGQMLIEHIRQLREDAVPLTAISDTIGMSRQALSLHVAQGAKAVATVDDLRPITAKEAKKLHALYVRLPKSSSGARVWSTADGLQLIDDITALVEDGVPVASVHRRARDGRVTKTVDIAGIDSALGIPASIIGRMVSMRDRLAAS